MNKSSSRLRDMLSDFRFETGLQSKVERYVAFFRARSDEPLYEWITCEFVGRKGDAAICWIGVSATRLVQFKGLTEFRLLDDVATDQERGWTVIDGLEELHAWEASVVKHAVPRVSVMDDKVGCELLEKTRESRRLAGECVRHVNAFGTFDEAFSAIKDRASSDQYETSQRLAHWPGVVQVPGAASMYELACLAILTGKRSDKLPDLSNASETPLEDERLMWEIQLVVDGVLAGKSDQRLSP